MWKIFSRSRSVQEDQQRLFFALEKIVNIALVKTERGDNQSVKEILNDLEKIFRRFWQLKKDDPDKFNSLLWSKDFFERYIEPSEKQEALVEDDLKRAESVEEKMKEASILLTFAARKQLKGLTQFLASFEKIWECALRTDNNEISRYVVYHLHSLLAELTLEPTNDLFVEEFLRLMNSMTWKAIQTSKLKGRLDVSVYSASIFWYTDIVFRRIVTREGVFDVSYLNLFDRHFFSIVKYIISENQTELFHVLVSSLVDRILPVVNEGAIWDYGHLILLSNPRKYQELDNRHGIVRRIQELAGLESVLDTHQKLNQWLKKFGELKEILQPHFSDNQKAKASKLEREIEEVAVSQFKHSNLLEVVFAIGAYCLFKQKPEYIRYLWEYKQPPDSDASWIGPDIIPTTLNGIMTLYFGREEFERKFGFWEGHHGTEQYYKQYFLLLVARILQNMAKTSEKNYEQIRKYKLPDWDIHLLSSIEGSADNLIFVVERLRKHEELLGTLGFDVSNLDELFDKGLIRFLRILKAKAHARIKDTKVTQRISLAKLTDFRKRVLDSFNEEAIMRGIFKNYNLYQDKTKETYEGSLKRVGRTSVDQKAAFFEKWHIHYADWGTQYGKSFAFGEDSHLLGKIAENCREIGEKPFEEVLSNFDDLSNVIILATNVVLFRFFERSENFKPKWYKDIRQLNLKGFEGWYEFRGERIPIFGTYQRNVSKRFLILNKSRLGQLIQYSPLDRGEDENLIEDIFYIKVQAFSEDEELLSRFIDSSPKWLQEVGDEREQREYLLELVLIQIFERFEYNVHERFEGYLLRLKE